MLVMTSYASTIYQSLSDGLRHDQNSVYVFRRPIARTYIKGRYVNCQLLQSFQVCLNLFGAKMGGSETQVCRQGDVFRAPIRVPDHIYSVIYASFTRFRIFFKTESFFSIFFFFFFFFFKKKKKIKKPLTRYVAYLNRFRRLHKNGKTTEIHCMIASLTEHA